MAQADQELAPGSRVDRYEVLGLLGGGGFGLVYAARHLHLGQTVALKLLRLGFVGSPLTVERFFREARAAAAVGSPHIVEVLDCGVVEQSGQPFIAMELLEGTTLDKLVGRGASLAPERAVGIALQLLDGLGAAHAAGIVHRDLKPANVFLRREPGSGVDAVKILDFGASKVQQHALEKALTRTGAWVGTPAYMAPEQFLGSRDVDARADLYAVAAVLFEMLTGRLPIIARSAGELAELVLTTRPAVLSDLVSGLPAGLVAAVDRGLAKAPEARWQSSAAFAEALREGMGMRAPLETGATLVVAGPTHGSSQGFVPGPSTPAAPAPSAPAPAPTPASTSSGPGLVPARATTGGTDPRTHAPPSTQGAAQVVAAAPRARLPGRWLLVVALVGGLAGMLGGALVAGGVALFSALSPRPSSTAGAGGAEAEVVGDGPRTVSGSLSTPGQRVPIPLRLSSARFVTITVVGQGLDPTVRLVDGSGAQLGFDDDSGGGLSARLSLQLGPGSYVVEVGGYGTTTGPFSCTIQ